MKKTGVVLLGLCLAVILTGCASEKAKAEALKAKQNEKDYVDYYPTGSNIPIRVRKDQLKPSDSETAQAQSVMMDVQQRGSVAPSDPETSATNRK
jgi:PBP1b-binding outer membrane lipoprotein LpoB